MTCWKKVVNLPSEYRGLHAWTGLLTGLPSLPQILAWLVSDIQASEPTCHLLRGLPCSLGYISLSGPITSHFLLPQYNYPYLIFPSSVISLPLDSVLQEAATVSLECTSLSPEPSVWHKTHAQKHSRKECVCFLIQTLPLVFICCDGTVEVLMEINDSWTLKPNEWPCQIRALSSVQFHYVISNIRLSFACCFCFLVTLIILLFIFIKLEPGCKGKIKKWWKILKRLKSQIT